MYRKGEFKIKPASDKIPIRVTITRTAIIVETRNGSTPL